MLQDTSFLKIAHEVGQGSKCISKKVWALIVRDNRILSSGYNGTPSGYVNCSDYFNWEYTKEHHDWSAKFEIHSEMNAIVWAARQGISIEGGTMYVMYEPCFQCTKNIVAAGIKKIVYGNSSPHVDSEYVRQYLEDNNVEILQIDLGPEYAFQETFKRN